MQYNQFVSKIDEEITKETKKNKTKSIVNIETLIPKEDIEKLIKEIKSLK